MFAFVDHVSGTGRALRRSAFQVVSAGRSIVACPVSTLRRLASFVSSEIAMLGIDFCRVLLICDTFRSGTIDISLNDRLLSLHLAAQARGLTRSQMTNIKSDLKFRTTPANARRGVCRIASWPCKSTSWQRGWQSVATWILTNMIHRERHDRSAL